MSGDAPKITAKAPGKVVLWGEYAVLAGAPAAVMAIDRLAMVTLSPRASSWQITAAGLATPGLMAHSAYTQAPVASMCEAILAAWGYDAYPSNGAEVHIDTQAFYQTHTKLGIGSSAAVCVGLYVSLAKLLDRTPSCSEAMDIHRAWQGGRGSGLDIATSWHGGTVFFRDGSVSSFEWPDHLYFTLVWTGTQAATRDHLHNFSAWQRDTPDMTPLNSLATAAQELSESIQLDNLAAYTQALRGFDEATKLNIFSPPHDRLATIAARLDVTYKPCGAGGGDIGIAIHDDRQVLERFAEAAAKDFVVLPSEIATHGVKLSA